MRCFGIRWIDQNRSRRTFELLAIIWLAGLCDFYFTVWAHRFTIFDEINPWACMLMRHHQLASMGLTKLILVAGSSAIFWAVRKHRVTEMALWGLLAVHVGLIVRWSIYTANALEMWAYCPAAPTILMHEPTLPSKEILLELAHSRALALAASLQESQAPRVSGAPTALFLVNNPQNWPKPRT